MSEYFFEYMRELLGKRYDAFYDAYTNKPRHKALRVNTNKISVNDFKALYGGELKQNPLCGNSFYCDVKPSLDPLYHAGLYYMQEPSASAAVAAFAPYIGERVLDLCAAPGGKSTQAAEYMRGGVLFCNDVETKRVSALTENIKRLGVKNAVVTCRTAKDYIEAGFEEYFDTLIVDAPCSGGGMMRYENVPYSENIVKGCAARQREILKDAVKLLCGGGYMLYSTCTFSKEENEDNVNYLQALGMSTVDIPLLAGTERGIDMPDARRIYPIDFDGEGHFFCVLQKTVGGKAEVPMLRKKVTQAKFGNLTVSVAESNGKHQIYRYLDIDDFDVPYCTQLYPFSIGVEAVTTELSIRESFYYANYALVHALSKEQLAALGAVEAGDKVNEYLSGKQLDISVPIRGYVAVTYNGYALGFGYSAPTGSGDYAIKNGYPKHLRIKN